VEHTLPGIAEDRFAGQGWHVDGAKLQPYDGDDFPRWIRERRCPESWWRPRVR